MTPRRPALLTPDSQEAPPPAELLEVDDANLEALATLDRRGKVGNTAVQVGIPFAIVVVVAWLARLAGLDLAPGDGVDLPVEVAGAWEAIVAVLLAWWMHRPKKPAA